MLRALLGAILALGVALQPAAAAPVTVRDAFDRSVTVPAPPQRIVAIFASNVEMLAALGLADRIVGIESFTRYPPEVLGKPLVGGRLGFSVDEVVAQKPDLVVVTPSRQAANQLIDPMERLGIPIVVLLQRNVEEILSNIRLLARLCSVVERGEELVARLRARLDRVEQRVAGLKPPSVVMITGRLGNGLLLVTLLSNFGTFVLYGLTNIVCIVAFREHHEFSGFKHMVVPVFGAVANFACLAFYIIGPLEGLGSAKEPLLAVAFSVIWAVYGAIYFTRNSRRRGRETVLMERPA